MSEKLFKKLGLNSEEVNVTLVGISQNETPIFKKAYTKIKSRIENFARNLSFLIKPDCVTEKLPIVRFSRSSFNYPKNIHLADEEFNVPKDNDVLLGTGVFFELLKSGNIRLGNDLPVLQATYLGWVDAGHFNVQNENNQSRKAICNFASEVTNRDLYNALTKFWQIEDLGNKKYLSKDEEYCEKYFKLTTKRNSEGQFIGKYPFKQNLNYQLGDSKSIALKRFNNLETRFRKNEIKIKNVYGIHARIRKFRSYEIQLLFGRR